MGVIFALTASVTYTLGSIIVQLLDRAIPDLQLNFYRSFGQVLCSAFLLAAKRQQPVVRGKGQTIFTTVFAISAAIQNLLTFVAVLLIPVGTTGSLFHASTLIFTTLGVVLFRVESLSCRKLTVLSISLIGISLTLFSTILNDKEKMVEKPLDDDVQENQLSSNWSNFKNQTVTDETVTQKGHQQFWLTGLFGIILAIGSGLAQTIETLTAKKVFEMEPPATGPVLSFWANIAGIPISIILVPILEKLTFVSDMKSIFLIIAHALVAGISIITYCLAIERAPPLIVSLAYTCDLPLRTLMQYLVIPDFQPPGGGIFDIFGSAVVTIALCVPGFWFLMDKRRRQKGGEGGEGEEELIPLKETSAGQ